MQALQTYFDELATTLTDRLTGEEVYSVGDGFEGIADRKISLEDVVELDPAA